MEISKYSEKRFYGIARYWDVDREYSEPMFNYLVYGISPGSFFTYVLANDWANAILSSHPSNTILSLKTLTKWMINCMPYEARGNPENVQRWLCMSNEERRAILEDHGLILSAQDETWAALNS